VGPYGRLSAAQAQGHRRLGRRAGLSPRRERDRAVSRGLTVNGLAILNERPELGLYYAAHLIGGAGAFVLTAETYEDFAEAMRDKLLHEISGFAVATAASDLSGSQ
jgi:hypothetical protein